MSSGEGSNPNGAEPAVADALARLADELRADEVIAPHVTEPSEPPTLGELVASGPRAADAPEQYGLLIEAIREGFLMHYGEPRLVSGADGDLRLLTGDYLYALGLERLASRGDTDAVNELADLISLCAQVNARPDDDDQLVRLLWLASAVAVGAGGGPPHEAAKRAVREGETEGPDLLAASAAEIAARSGMGPGMARAADSIGFARKHLFERA
ncbi:MAG: hypothetical protein FJW90_05215 [Actinobacteria bacterium]|nr:hypothetical protein [Actinomycetota bacterium]